MTSWGSLGKSEKEENNKKEGKAEYLHAQKVKALKPGSRLVSRGESSVCTFKSTGEGNKCVFGGDVGCDLTGTLER